MSSFLEDHSKDDTYSKLDLFILFLALPVIVGLFALSYLLCCLYKTDATSREKKEQELNRKWVLNHMFGFTKENPRERNE